MILKLSGGVQPATRQERVMNKSNATKQITTRNEKRLARKNKKPLIINIKNPERFITEDVRESIRKGIGEAYLKL